MQAITANIKTERRPLGRSNLLSLYTTPPSEELTLDEFELLTMDRLQLLRAMETLKSKGYEEPEFNSRLAELEKKHLLGSSRQTSRLSDRERDLVSHFILRLAYCRSEDLRRWYLTQECALFKHRLDMLSDDERAQFMHENGLQYDSVGVEEKTRLIDRLTGLSGVTPQTFPRASYYKVPFQQALSLLGSRQVYLEAGMVYVPLGKLVSILTSRFRILLSRALVEAANLFDVISSDQRIGPFLANVNKQFVGNDFANRASIDKLTVDQIDAVADAHMPLCMKNLHMALKRDHKVKHWGRLQYGLFLKGAGLDMEQAMLFWESHFTKVMNHDAFHKGYAYSFRHMYGKEGARKNYTPYSCLKIIMGTPPEAGAFHGCPYRHATDSQLAGLLNGLKLSVPDAKEVIGIAKSGNYQLACQKHFDITHPGHQIAEAVANHPNAWLQGSMAYFKAKNGISAAAPTEGGAGDEVAAGDAPTAAAVEEGVAMEV